MRSRVAGHTWVGILALAAAGVAGAHHPPAFERCQVVTVVGDVQRVQWTNPHVLLTVQAEDGVVYAVAWRSVQQLSRSGVPKDTLHVGDRVTLTVSRQSGGRPRPWLLQGIRRSADGWQWSQPPQGC
jgi:hypothetical protein